jgi:hypothetical protein
VPRIMPTTKATAVSASENSTPDQR